MAIFDFARKAASAKKIVLVVDDEPHNIRIIADRLKMTGYDTFTAKDGLEALEMLQKETPDLVLLDIKMPKLDGFATLERIRMMTKMAKVPVIMLTACAEPDDLEQAFSKGASDYIVKPFNFAELLEKIKDTLARTKK